MTTLHFRDAPLTWIKLMNKRFLLLYFLISSASLWDSLTQSWSFSDFYKNSWVSSSETDALFSGSSSSALAIISRSLSSKMLSKICCFSPLLIILQNTHNAWVPETSFEIISSKDRPKQNTSSFVVWSEFFMNVHYESSEYLLL